MGAYKYSPEPRSQLLARLQIVHAKGGGSEKLSIRMRNPCNRQLISIQVRLQFFDSSLRGSFPKNRVPLFEQPLRQLRDVFGVLKQVANLNSAHTNSVVRSDENKLSHRLKQLNFSTSQPALKRPAARVLLIKSLESCRSSLSKMKKP